MRDATITQLAIDVRAAQEHRKEVQAAEIEAKDKLVAAMRERGLTEYRDDEADVSVRVKTYEPRCWVKTAQQEHDEGEK